MRVRSDEIAKERRGRETEYENRQRRRQTHVTDLNMEMIETRYVAELMIDQPARFYVFLQRFHSRQIPSH